MLHSYNPSTGKAETGGFLGLPGQPAPSNEQASASMQIICSSFAANTQ